MRKQTFNYIKNQLIEYAKFSVGNTCEDLEFFNFEDNMMYMFHNDQEVIQVVYDWLLELFPAYAGMIDYGATKGLEVTMSGSRPSYYASIPIYPEKETVI